MTTNTIIPVLDQPAATLGDVARKLLRYLRLDDSRRVVDWRRLDGGAHRLAVCDLADALLGDGLVPGGDDFAELSRQYEAAVRESLGAADAMDAKLDAMPDWSAGLGELESTLMSATQLAGPFESIRLLVGGALASCTILHDKAEEEAGVSQLRQRIGELSALADTWRQTIEEARLDTIGAAAARLRMLSCDRLMADRDPTSRENRQLEAAISDLERMAVPGAARDAA